MEAPWLRRSRCHLCPQNADQPEESVSCPFILVSTNESNGTRSCLFFNYAAHTSRHWSSQIASWRKVHPREKPKHLLLYWRWGGLVERGQGGKIVLAELPHKLASPDARPPVESNSEIEACAFMSRIHGSATVFADGARSWRAHAKAKRLKFSQVNHSKMQFTKPRGPRRKAAGTQVLDRQWKSLKQYVPREVANKNALDRSVNDSLRAYVYSWVWRHNVGIPTLLSSLGHLASEG